MRPDIATDEPNDNDSLIPQYIPFRNTPTRARKASASPLAPSTTLGLRSAVDQEEGVEMAREFLGRLLSIFTQDIRIVTSAQEKHTHGALQLPNGHYVEVIRQSINPDRYPLNAARIAELTFNPLDPGTLALLGRVLGVETDVLRNCPVIDYRFDDQPVAPLGDPPHVYVTCQPSKKARVTMYVNPRDGHIYLYKGQELFDQIRRALTNQNLRRAQDGRSMDLLTTLIPLARWRFTLGRDGKWRYTGVGSPEDEKNQVRRWLEE